MFRVLHQTLNETLICLDIAIWIVCEKPEVIMSHSVLLASFPNDVQFGWVARQYSFLGISLQNAQIHLTLLGPLSSFWRHPIWLMIRCGKGTLLLRKCCHSYHRKLSWKPLTEDVDDHFQLIPLRSFSFLCESFRNQNSTRTCVRVELM